MPAYLKKLFIVMVAVLLSSTLSSQPLEAANSAYLTHLTGGYSDWQDYLQVDNTGLTTETFTLILYDTDGIEIYHDDLTINAEDELIVDLKSLGGTAAAGKVVYDSSLLNFRLSFYNIAGGGVAEFQLTENLSSTLSFFFSEVGSMNVAWKGIAVTNYSDTAAVGKIYAYGGGELLGTADISIPAFSKLLGLHDTWFSSISISQIKRLFIECDAATLAGITISGNSDSSKMLFTAAAPTPSDFTGTWIGPITSTKDGDVEQSTLELTQNGNLIEGTGTSSDTTACGAIELTGTVTGNIATLSFDTYCMGGHIELEYTEGRKIGDTFSGSYKVYVNSRLNDEGNFILTRTTAQ